MNIAVLRALQLGDLLCAVPALRALCAAYPAARITLIGLPWAREFAARFRSYLHDFVEFPGFPGLAERPWDAGRLPRFFHDLQGRRFDLALQMHGSGEITNTLVAMIGARHSAGFFREGHFCPDPERFVPWRDGEHEVQRYLRLVARLGVRAEGSELEFPLGNDDWREWTALGLEPGSYAVVHPGSQLPSRRWLPEQLKRIDAVSNQRALLTLLYGLERGDKDAIRAGFEDRLHVPHRKGMIVGYDQIVQGALDAGAFGVTISGAGGSMIAIGQGDMKGVAEAMKDAYVRNGMEARAYTPEVDKQGLVIEQL